MHFMTSSLHKNSWHAVPPTAFPIAHSAPSRSDFPSHFFLSFFFFFFFFFFSLFLPLLQPATSLSTSSLLVNSFVIYRFTKTWTFSNVSEYPLSSQPPLTLLRAPLPHSLDSLLTITNSFNNSYFLFFASSFLATILVAYYRARTIPFFSIPLSVSKPPCEDSPRTSTVQSSDHLPLFSLVSSIVHLAATAANSKNAYALAAPFSG